MSAAPSYPQASSHRSAQHEGTPVSPAFSICVYCGSRAGSRTEFSAAATAVGSWIGSHGGQLVYGGGRSGLMGIVAHATLQAGGQVVGIIPKALVEKELADHDCTELHIVDTMHERKRMMAERADAFLALPGGIGTFEEFFEAWTWRQLGYHDKPVGLLNIAGYYDKLLEFLRASVEQQFMGDWQMTLMREGAEPAALLRELVESAGLSPQPRLDAI
ncbi:TIGR00730 family Rossman fold protein [Polaromonas sp. C04]|uniref:LOG family protein n=1 Tax=Polaromonas sp. C04 TaxID=1945857 RepID=UPI000985FF06|nr:TIGR00730 family Rossman fold protein [Polaromonas sp. C04]